MPQPPREDPIRVGNGAGFLGDWLDAPKLLVERGKLDYLTLEYLAELTMSILARQREKDPDQGYATDFVDVLAGLCPFLVAQPKLKIVTNAGGVSPIACASAAARVLSEAELEGTAIGVVSGDEITHRLAELTAAGCRFENLETGQPLADLAEPVVSAHAYLGAPPIAAALAGGARLVITGRVADASLALAPAAWEHGWAWDDWPRLAGGTVAGHLIECGAQVTGGYSTSGHWRRDTLVDVGYPIAEIAADGSCTITKPPGTGGRVDRYSVAEQLVYEIGDPAHYLTPDVDANFTTVELKETGPDRVAARGATGGPPPEEYKVSLAYRAGYTAAGQLVVRGRDAIDKGDAVADIIVGRVRRAGFELAHVLVERLGAGDAVPGHPTQRGRIDATTSPFTWEPADEEIVLRIAARDPRREAVERFSGEFAPLITSGPGGLAGYAAGRPIVRPAFAYWPTRVPRSFIEPKIKVLRAADWLAIAGAKPKGHRSG